MQQDTCPFTCKKYSIQDKEGRTCQPPASRQFVNNQGTIQECAGSISRSASLGGQAVEVTDANQCPFTCLSGYVKDTQNRACNPPGKGKYANAEGVEADCDDIEGDVGGFENFVKNTGASAVAVSSPTGCGFTCNAGFIKDIAGRTCRNPNVGEYANAQGQGAQCTGAAIPHIDRLGGQGGMAVPHSDQCPFTCKAGYIINGSDRSCDIPTQGHYANAQGVADDCDDIGGLRAGFKTFEDNVGPVDSATGCPFSCNAGYVKNTAGRTCNIPGPGKYADAQGDERDCGPKPNSNWASNTGAVPTANDCALTCTGNTLKNTRDNTCDPPNAGKWLDGSTETSCSPIDNRQSWIAASPLPSTDTCDFDCQAGYKKVNTNSRRACDTPQPGNYLQANGSEASCNPIPRSSWVASPASTSTECDFSCDSGYEKHGRSCRIPPKGQWADGGIAKPCTPIDHSDWVANTGAVPTAAGCDFSCESGFTKNISNRSCDLNRGHFIASDGSVQSCGNGPLQ